MALGCSPEYHWDQIIPKSVHSRRSRLKLFSIYSPEGHFSSTERNGLSNFCRQSPKKHSCIIISKSMHYLRRRSHLKVFYFQLWWPSCSMAQNSLSNFSRELPKEPSCEIIPKSTTDLAEEVV